MIKRILIIALSVQLIHAESIIRMHVFVHGSKLTSYSISTAVSLLSGQTTDRTLSSYDNKPVHKYADFFDKNLILDDGLIIVSDAALQNCRSGNLPPQLSRRAATHIINAYDTFTHTINTIDKYYTFGWSGTLDGDYRNRESRTLYNSLMAERARLQRQYPNKHIEFIVHGQGHGGTIILCLADRETEHREIEHKDGLEIACVVLYGTPIQVEAIHTFQHPMFKAIINVFSMGDKIQTADTITTKEQSYRTIHEILTWENTPTKYLVDVGIQMNGYDDAFSHASFFYLDDACYQSALFELIRPLPVVAFSPFIIDFLQKASKKPIRASLNVITSTSCYLELSAPGLHRHFMTKDLAPALAPIKQVIDQTWRPNITYHNQIQASARAIKRAVVNTPQSIYDNYLKSWFE